MNYDKPIEGPEVVYDDHLKRFTVNMPLELAELTEIIMGALGPIRALEMVLSSWMDVERIMGRIDDEQKTRVQSKA